MNKEKLMKEQLDLNFIEPKQKKIIENIYKYRKGEIDPWKIIIA